MTPRWKNESRPFILRGQRETRPLLDLGHDTHRALSGMSAQVSYPA